MNVGQQAQAVTSLDVGQHLQSLFQAGASEGVDRRAVGLVKRGFEDDVATCFPVNINQFLSHCVEQFCRFNDAWACNESLLFHNFNVQRYTFFIKPQRFQLKKIEKRLKEGEYWKLVAAYFPILAT
jgi:hypothetical protein